VRCSEKWISGDDILYQFEYVLNELKHSLSVIERMTFSNDGSILDEETMPTETLVTMVKCVNEVRRVRKLVLETRLEFVIPQTVQLLEKVAPRAKVNILTGFETLDPHIREEILGKKETIAEFEVGLDRVAEADAALTAFVLYKPSQKMTDPEAYLEASRSIEYLKSECGERQIDLTIRLNPMYAAKGSVWASVARHTPTYRPSRLSDIIELAKREAGKGTGVYIGLSTEELEDEWGTYRDREDFSRELLKQAILFNTTRRIASSV
jgi:hypothetical protein